MNKKGFTLIELLVSIVILSIIMVFITSFILNLNGQKGDAQLDLNLLVNQAAISKTINYDAYMYGIDTVNCESTKKCTITFKSGDLIKTIEITDNNKSIKYYDASNVYMIRTLSGEKTFGDISVKTEEFSNPGAKFNEIAIGFNENAGYDIKVYDYRLNRTLYTVTIDANGGSYSGEEIPSLYPTDQYDLNLLSNSTKIGYIFTGWTTNSVGSSINGATFTMGDSNAIIKANWTPITYYVRYNANGGSGSTATSTHTYDTSKALTANGFSKAGNTFTGWATSANGAVVYSNGVAVKNLTSTNGTTIDLFAKWSTNTYTVTLNNMGATTPGTTSLNAVYGANLSSITIPSMTNYAFGGYYTGQNGSGTQYISASGTPTRAWDIASNTTLYAKWTKSVYTITLKCNGGTGGTTYHSCNLGQTYTINSLRNTDACGYSITSSMIQYVSSWSSASYTCNSDTTINANWSNLFSYSGNYEFINEGSNYWRMRFKSSGTLYFAKQVYTDVFLVGGGGGGGENYGYKAGGGGGGGYVSTTVRQPIIGSCSVTVGAGGNPNSAGSPSSIVCGSTGVNLSIGGGTGGGAATTSANGAGGAGGSGGGGGGHNGSPSGGGNGGSNGSSGAANGRGNAAGGSGNGVSTYEFGNTSLTLYSGGGAGGGGNRNSGTIQGAGTDGSGNNANNTGGGGTGACGDDHPTAGCSTLAESGYSGIVVIRNAR